MIDLDLDRGEVEDPIELIGRERATRLGILLVALGLTGLLIFGGGIAVGLGSAQESANGSQSDAVEETPDDPDVATERLDSNVRVGEYGYDADREIFHAELIHTGSETSRITATELVSESGAGSFGVQQLELRPGETVTVEVSVEERSGSNPGIMIVSQESLSNGSGVYLIEEGDFSLFSGDASWSFVRVGAIGGATGVIGLLLGLSWMIISSRDSEWEVIT
jgi:hypothetical protein